MSVVEQIEEIITPIVYARDAFIVDLIVRGSQNGKVVEVFVDTDDGITTSKCAEISHEIAKGLDTANTFTHRYQLVVSSPGIDRPLKFARQYPRNIGRTLSVSYHGQNQIEKLQGALVEATGEAILLRSDGEEVKRIMLDSIVEAYVKTAW